MVHHIPYIEAIQTNVEVTISESLFKRCGVDYAIDAFLKQGAMETCHYGHLTVTYLDVNRSKAEQYARGTIGYIIEKEFMRG